MEIATSSTTLGSLRRFKQKRHVERAHSELKLALDESNGHGKEADGPKGRAGATAVSHDLPGINRIPSSGRWADIGQRGAVESGMALELMCKKPARGQSPK